ncbi:MAG: T9SS type A sorting domain-containing protein, partial [Bacteroidota bacterium]
RGGLSEGRALCEQEFRISEPSEEEVQSIEQLKVFPNPAKDQLAIVFDSDLAGLLSMNIFNNNGQLFHRQEVQTDGKALNLSVDCSDWPEGIYMIQAAIDGQSWHQKVTVSK